MENGICKPPKAKVEQWWSQESNTFLDFIPPLKDKLYKTIGQIVSDTSHKAILDYGCGLGTQLSYLSPEKEVYVFDINENAASSVVNKYSEHFNAPPQKLNEAPNCGIDTVIANMVWMCFSDINAVHDALSRILQYLKQNATILISITNPNARHLDFSYFSTEWIGNSINYKAIPEGTPFKVFIKDETSTQFTDHHWSVSAISQALRIYGFALHAIQPLQDEHHKGFANYTDAPYLILTYKISNK